MGRRKGSKNKSKNDKEVISEDISKSGRKARTGLPQINMLDAITYVKKAYQNTGSNLKSFAGMAQAMGIAEAFFKRASGELREYGLITQEGTGWKITDLGRRAANGERSAVIEVLETNSIMKDLYSELKDKNYDRDYIEDFIRKKRFAYNINVSLVADRFLLAMGHIKNLVEGEPYVVGEERNVEQTPLFIKIIKLKYALFPPSKSEIKGLVEDLSLEAESNKDIAIKSLIGKMVDKKDNEAELKTLMELLIEIVSNKYPSFSLEGNDESEDSN